MKSLNARQVFSVLVCFCLSLWSISSKSENALNAAIERQTVQILCKSANGVGFGSGFLINKGRMVVTNWHVASCLDETREVVKIGLVTAAGEESELSLEWFSRTKDLAILKLAKPLREEVIFATRSTLEKRDPVIVAGFPFAAIRSERDIGHVSFSEGIISNFTDDQGVNHIQTSAPVNHGNSGGPLYNNKGNVIGIVVSVALTELEQGQGQVAATGIGYAILVDELLVELDSLHIPYQAKRSRLAGEQDASPLTPTSPVPSALPTPPVQPPGLEQVPAPVPVEPPSVSQPVAIPPVAPIQIPKEFWIAFGLITALMITIIARVQRRSPSGPEPAAYQPKAPTASLPYPPVRNNPRLRCLKGPDAGGVVPLSLEPLVLGRDARQSQWVMPADAKRISRRHCQLRWDGRTQLTLEDVGSANGTFIGDGRKLMAGVPVALKDGDRFYLGSPDHQFLVEWN